VLQLDNIFSTLCLHSAARSYSFSPLNLSLYLFLPLRFSHLLPFRRSPVPLRNNTKSPSNPLQAHLFSLLACYLSICPSNKPNSVLRRRNTYRTRCWRPCCWLLTAQQARTALVPLFKNPTCFLIPFSHSKTRRRAISTPEPSVSPQHPTRSVQPGSQTHRSPCSGHQAAAPDPGCRRGPPPAPLPTRTSAHRPVSPWPGAARGGGRGCLQHRPAASSSSRVRPCSISRVFER